MKILMALACIALASTSAQAAAYLQFQFTASGQYANLNSNFAIFNRTDDVTINIDTSACSLGASCNTNPFVDFLTYSNSGINAGYDFLDKYTVQFSGTFASVDLSQDTFAVTRSFNSQSMKDGYTFSQYMIGKQIPLGSANLTIRGSSSAFGPLGLNVSSSDIFVAPAPPGVPEPNTWMLMLVGFGSIGSALRYRKDRRRDGDRRRLL